MSDNASDQRVVRRREIARVSTAQAIVNELTTEILDGSLEGGAELREVELSERFGVSRQSLRAALAQLAFMGLATREPHRSTRVPTISRADLDDIYYLREIIEGEAIRWVTVHDETWGAIETELRKMEDRPTSAPWSDLVEADVAFHSAIVQARSSPRLVRAHQSISHEMRLILVPARNYLGRDEMTQSHRELLAAIRLGNPETAMAALRAHLEFGTDRLRRYLTD